MRCSTAHKLISPYIDGELSEGKKREIENHLNACEKCRMEVEGFQGMRDLFVNTENYEAPYGFHTRVMANINSGKTRQSSRIPVFARLAEGFVVMVIIAIIVIGVFSGSFLIKGFMPDKAKEVMASLSFDVFDSEPPGSLGGAYLAMTEVRNEK